MLQTVKTTLMGMIILLITCLALSIPIAILGYLLHLGNGLFFALLVMGLFCLHLCYRFRKGKNVKNYEMTTQPCPDCGRYIGHSPQCTEMERQITNTTKWTYISTYRDYYEPSETEKKLEDLRLRIKEIALIIWKTYLKSLKKHLKRSLRIY